MDAAETRATILAILRGDLPAEPDAAKRTASFTAGQLNLKAGDRVVRRTGPGVYHTDSVDRAPYWRSGQYVVCLTHADAPVPLRDVWPSDLPPQAWPIGPHDYQI